MAEQVVWKVNYSDGSSCHFGNYALAIASARGGKVEEVRIKHAVLSVVCAPEKQDREADLESAGHRLALELECLLMDTKDLPTVSKWWDSAHEALDGWRALHEYQGPRLGDS